MTRFPGRSCRRPCSTVSGCARGNAIEGPAVIEYPTTTLTLCSGQRTELNALLGVEIRRAGCHGSPSPSDYVLGPHPARWTELERPLAVDPVTFEILRHKLEAINEEQAIALKDVSVSPIVTAASDFNNALYTADGRIASMGRQVVFHSGEMPVVLRHVMEAFPADEIDDGDMFVVNDPFYGAVHHPDVSLVAPIFHGDELIAWAGVAAHQVDMGGMSVGSIFARAREAAGGADDAADQADRARAPARRRLAADPQHDPAAPDGGT